VSPALELIDVSKRFQSRWALARVSFTLPSGRSLLLTGHNGSGKTTLLRLIATATSPNTGQVKVFGADAVSEKEQVRRQVALLSHASFLYEDLTAQQNLELVARLCGTDNVKSVTEKLLDQVKLSARSQNPVRQFSAGMRKRLAIARLLIKAPRLALLDEPFGELDPQGIAEMESIIRQLQDTGTSIVLATHLIEQGQSLTQERLHLDNGRRVEASAQS
jgi:heme exporter protein A